MSRELPDQTDTLGMIEAAFGARDILCNGAPGDAPARYLSDWIERLIAKRVEEAVRLEREAKVPAGWMLVPIEPTEEMLDAACDVDARAQVERKNLIRFPGLMPYASAGDVWRIQYQAALGAIRARSQEGKG